MGFPAGFRLGKQLVVETFSIDFPRRRFRETIDLMKKEGPVLCAPFRFRLLLMRGGHSRVQRSPVGLDERGGRSSETIRGSAAVVFLGDHVDRGPDSKGVIAAIQSRALRASFDQVVCLKGNHETTSSRGLSIFAAHQAYLEVL